MGRRASAVPRLGAGLVAWALLVATLLVAGAARASADPTVAFTIKNPEITKSSGLAADPDTDLYWTVNNSSDSGDTSGSGQVFALNATGHLVGTMSFRADLTDVEAVAYANGVLYVADIGDPNSDRDHVTVYLLSSPQPDGQTVLYHAYDFAYPDGPHNASALLVSPGGQLYLVTKGAHGAIYQAPAEPSTSEVNTLTKVAAAPPYVTDGLFLADGRIALRSYVDVSILDPNQDYKVVARAATPYQPRGESLTQSVDGDSLLVGSEGKQSKVYSMPIPTTMASVPSPSATPPASPDPASSDPASPSAAPSDSDPGGQSDDPDSQNQNTSSGGNGTTEALLVAAGVAILAGLIVFFARSRRS